MNRNEGCERRLRLVPPRSERGLDERTGLIVPIDATQAEIEATAQRVLASAERSLALSVICMLHASVQRARAKGDAELVTFYRSILEACRDEIDHVLRSTVR